MIVGVDVSSRRIDLAWLEDGKPQRWHQELGKGHLIDRLRSIHVQWPMTVAHARGVVLAPGADVTDIAIEYPFARQQTAIAALMAVTGIVTRQAPPWARVAWPSSGELRAAIGAANNKQSAHERVAWHIAWNTKYTDKPYHDPLDRWGPDELDALVAAVGWTRILEQQEAA